MATGSDIATEAQRFIGDPYVYGATGPNTFDCSGLVQYVFHLKGLKVPRTSQEQYAAASPISDGQLRPGDLVFSAGSDGTATHPGHVGIFVGKRSGVPTVVEAPHTGANVRYTPLANFQASGYRRVQGLTAGGATDAGYTIPLPLPGGGFIPIPIPGLGGDGGDSGLGGLLSIPTDIIGFFKKATDDLTAVGAFFWAFTQPATWVRIGSGALGSVLLLAGLVFLIMAANAS